MKLASTTVDRYSSYRYPGFNAASEWFGKLKCHMAARLKNGYQETKRPGKEKTVGVILTIVPTECGLVHNKAACDRHAYWRKKGL